MPTASKTIGQLRRETSPSFRRAKPIGHTPKEKTAARGYGGRWQKARRTFLLRNPLCAHCKAKGITKLALDVDHIIPHRKNQKLFWDTSNWQALCHPCHARKTAREGRGVKGKVWT